MTKYFVVSDMKEKEATRHINKVPDNMFVHVDICDKGLSAIIGDKDKKTLVGFTIKCNAELMDVMLHQINAGKCRDIKETIFQELVSVILDFLDNDQEATLHLDGLAHDLSDELHLLLSHAADEVKKAREAEEKEKSRNHPLQASQESNHQELKQLIVKSAQCDNVDNMAILPTDFKVSMGVDNEGYITISFEDREGHGLAECFVPIEEERVKKAQEMLFEGDGSFPASILEMVMDDISQFLQTGHYYDEEDRYPKHSYLDLDYYIDDYWENEMSITIDCEWENYCRAMQEDEET